MGIYKNMGGNILGGHFLGGGFSGGDLPGGSLIVGNFPGGNFPVRIFAETVNFVLVEFPTFDEAAPFFFIVEY